MASSRPRLRAAKPTFAKSVTAPPEASADLVASKCAYDKFCCTLGRLVSPYTPSEIS